MNRLRLIGAALLTLSSAAMLLAAAPTTSARDDGKAFATAQKPLAAAKAKNAPNADDLPNFSASPTESDYYSDAAALDAAGPAQASASPGYLAVTESLATRARFPDSEINRTVTVGRAVAASPSTYTSGFSATGSTGSCVPLPPSNMSPGTYEQSCNSGYIQEPGAGTVTCAVSLDHSFSTSNRYECSQINAATNGTDHCSIYDANFGAHCSTTGYRDGVCLSRYPDTPGACAEQGERVRQLSCSTTVPGANAVGTETSNRYECSQINAATNGTDQCSIYDANFSSQCNTTGYRDGVCLSRYPATPGGCAEQGEQVRQLTCSVAVPGANVVGTQTFNRYECSELNAAFNGTDDCRTYDEGARGVCVTTGYREGRCLTNDQLGCFEPGERIRQMSCGAVVPGGTLLGTDTVNRYECSRSDAATNGTDECALFDLNYGGVCNTTGYRDGLCRTRYPDTPGGCAEPGERIRQMTCGVAVPGGNILSSETVSRYECSTTDAATNRTDRCALFDDFGGVCNTTGYRDGLCRSRYPDTPGGCAEPGERIRQMTCDVVVPGGNILSSETVYRGSTVNDSACATPKADPLCTVSPDVCTDSSLETRIINGVPVTQPCWAWSRTYECVGPLTPASDCGELEGLGCAFVREQCLTGEQPCLTVDRVYSCPIPPVRRDNQQICNGDVYCLDGECDTIEREASTDFKDAAVALNVMNQMNREFDPNSLKLFDGDRLTCSKTIFGLTNCCVPRGFPLLGGCNAEDRALKQRRESGKCIYAGTYCDRQVFGICLRKKEAHCCFISKISRILQEQGRRQINKPFGNPRTEQCAGFTIAEFQQLDLSQMDFSEVYAEFTDAARVPGQLDVASEMQSKINAYYAANPR